MDWFHPEAVLLYILLLFFLSRKRWRFAFAVATFILLVGLFAAFLEGRYEENRSAAELGISILLIAGGVWFSVFALIGLLKGGKE